MARKHVARLSVHEASILLSLQSQGSMYARNFLSRPLGSLVSRGLVDVVRGEAALGLGVRDDAALLDRAREIVARDAMRDDYSPEAIDAAWDSAAAE